MTGYWTKQELADWAIRLPGLRGRAGAPAGAKGRRRADEPEGPYLPCLYCVAQSCSVN